jgi:hypothetical protein
VSPVMHTANISSCKKNSFSFPVAVNNSIKVGPLVFLLNIFVITENITKSLYNEEFIRFVEPYPYILRSLMYHTERVTACNVHRGSVYSVNNLGRTESVTGMGEVTTNSLYCIFILSSHCCKHGP